MTDAMGHYVGGGQRHLSQAAIQKMKKNMRKVPKIQEKSDQYHETENKEAEAFINEQLKTEKGPNDIMSAPQHLTDQSNISWLKKAFLWLQQHIQALYTLKQK